MSGKRRRRIFLFDAEDYRAAEAWLNAQADQGWELEGIWPGPLAVFTPTQRRDLQYAVTLDPTRGEGAREDAYLQLMEDAGWKKVEQKPGLIIFASIPGANPAPIQTDPEVERRQLFRYVRRGWLVSVIALAILAALYLIITLAMKGRYVPLISYELALRDKRVVAALAALPLAAALIWETAVLLRLWRAGRRTAEGGGALPALGGARARKLLAALAAVLLLASGVMDIVQASRRSFVSFYDGKSLVAQAVEGLPVVHSTDLGLERTAPIYVCMEPGLLVDRITYQESFVSGLFTDRFACANTALARWMAADMARAEGAEGIDGHFGCSEFELTPASLGFDQCWTYTCKSGNGLLLQEGPIVACVEGPFDLSDPALPAVLRERLELE